MKITIVCDVAQMHRAIELAELFISDYPDNHNSSSHPERHGVGFRYDDPDCMRWFFAYGNETHVRVKQQPSTFTETTP